MKRKATLLKCLADVVAYMRGTLFSTYTLLLTVRNDFK